MATSPIAEVETGTNGRTTYWARRTGGRRHKGRAPIPPVRRPRRGRRRSTIAALVATLAYAAAATAAYLLVVPVLRDDDAGATAQAPAATTPAVTPPAATDAADLRALRTLAARAQRSVFTVEGAGGVQGSGFIAWAAGGKSYLITSRTLVAGVLRDGGTTVFVRRGGSFWEADIAREDTASGLALLRVHDGIGVPLWGNKGTDSLDLGQTAMVVPAGPDAPLAEAPVVTWSKGAFVVDASTGALGVGAPVVGERGRVAGVVVSVNDQGRQRVVPLGRACGPIRACG